MSSSVFNLEQVTASNNGSEMLGDPYHRILNFVDQCGEGLPDSMNHFSNSNNTLFTGIFQGSLIYS